MKFAFRLQVQSCAVSAQKQSIGFRSAALHASAIAEAAERYLRDQLLRKREKTLARN